MKKFLTLTCAALASLSLALGVTACTPERNESSPTVSPSKVADLGSMSPLYTKYEANKTTIAKAEIVTGLEGYTFVASATPIGDGRFLRCEKKDEKGKVISIAIYNAVTGKILTFDCSSDYDNTTPETPVEVATRTWTFTAPSAVNSEAELLANNVLMATLKYEHSITSANNVTKTVVYGVDGAEIVSMFGELVSANVSYKNDFYTLSVNSTTSSGECYFDKNFALLDKAPDPLADMFTTNQEMVLDSYDTCYTVGDIDEAAGYLCVEDGQKYVSYNKDMEMQYVLEIPERIEHKALILFDSGNYILQYSERITDVSAKYDYLEYGLTDVYYQYNGAQFQQGNLNRYRLTTLLVNVTTNVKTELDCSFLLKNATVTPAKNTVYALPEGIDAFFKGIGEIGKDKRVKYEYNNVWFGVTEAGVITRASTLLEDVEVEAAVELSDGNLKVKDSTNRTYLVTKEGSLIKEINESVIGENTIPGERNRAFVRLGNGIYNQKYEKTYTLTSSSEVEKWSENATALFIKETTVVPAVLPATEPTYTYKWFLLKSGDLAATEIADSSKGQTVEYIEGLGYAVTTVTGTIADTNFSKTCVYYNEDGAILEMDSSVVIDTTARVYGYQTDVDQATGSFFYLYNTYDNKGQVISSSIMKFSY